MVIWRREKVVSKMSLYLENLHSKMNMWSAFKMRAFRRKTKVKQFY